MTWACPACRLPPAVDRCHNPAPQAATRRLPAASARPATPLRARSSAGLSSGFRSRSGRAILATIILRAPRLLVVRPRESPVSLLRSFVFILAALPLAASAGMKVSGRALEADTLAPLPGTTVELVEAFGSYEVLAQANADATGYFELHTDACCTHVQVIASLEGYREVIHDLGYFGGGSINRDLVLEPDLHGTIIVSVVDDRAGLPVAGINVRAQFTRADFSWSGVTANSGELTREAHPAGEFSICVHDRLGRYVPRCAVALQTSAPASPDPHRFDLLHGQTLHFTFRMEPGQPVSGLASEAIGQEPLRDARLSIDVESEDGDVSLTTVTTDQNGRFSLSSVLPGHYRLTAATSSGYVPSVHPALSCLPACPDGELIALGDAPVDDVVFRFESEASVEGRVVAAETGLPVAGVGVSARIWSNLGPLRVGKTAITDDEGRFRIDYINASSSTSVQTNNTHGYLDQIWFGRDCFFQLCGYGVVDWFPLARGELRSGLEFSLDAGVAIGGRVQGQVSSHSVQAHVTLHGSDGDYKWYHEHGPLTGEYMTGALPEGTYHARAISTATGECQWYPAVACFEDRNVVPPEAGSVTVGDSNVLGIDFLFDNRSVFRSGFN